MVTVLKKLSKSTRKKSKHVLKDYLELSKNLSKSSKGSQMKSTLKAVIPLAAAAIIPGQALNAQCWTSDTAVTSLIYQPLLGGCFYADTGPFGLDVDGDGSFDFGWAGAVNGTVAYTGTTTTGGGAMLRNLVDNFDTSFYMFGLGGAMINSIVGVASNTIQCSSTPGFLSTNTFWSQVGMQIVPQIYDTVAGAWANVGTGTTTPSFTSAGLLPPGPYIFPIQVAGSCGWVEIQYGYINGRTAMCFDSGGIEDPISDGDGVIHFLDCTSLVGAVLPVELIAFTAQGMEHSIKVDWTTESEINNMGFEVQRSTDGINFEALRFVNGSNNSNEKRNYSLEDKNVKHNQLYYYRLKNMDYDGRFEFSEVATAKVVNAQLTSISNVFPNPMLNGDFNVEVNLANPAKITIELFDTYGKLVYSSISEGTLGKNAIQLDLSTLSEGTYFSKVIADNESKYQKLIVL